MVLQQSGLKAEIKSEQSLYRLFPIISRPKGCAYNWHSTVRSSRTASVSFTGQRISYTSAGLICTHTIGEIVIERSQGIRTVVTHPRATSALRNCELYAICHRNYTDGGEIFMCLRNGLVTRKK